MEAEVNTNYPRTLYIARAFRYLTPYEAMYLMCLSRSLPPGAIIVNLGAGAGTSGLALSEPHISASELNYLPASSAQIITVDVSQESPLGGLTNEKNAFRNVGWEAEYPVQVLNDSKEIGNTWNGNVDLVFIDGDHSFDGVIGDIKAWQKNIIPGGLMVFHDYDSPEWSDVKPVVDDLMKDWITLPVVDRIAAFRKPAPEAPK